MEFAEAEAMCEYIPEILFVMETSAKENTNVDDAFVCLATELKVRLEFLLWQISSDENFATLFIYKIEIKILSRWSSVVVHWREFKKNNWRHNEDEVFRRAI